MAGQDPPYENGLLIGRGGSAPPPTLPPRYAQGEGLNGAADTASANAFVSTHRKAAASPQEP